MHTSKVETLKNGRMRYTIESFFKVRNTAMYRMKVRIDTPQHPVKEADSLADIIEVSKSKLVIVKSYDG